jgi:hypothetical protein
MLKPFIKLLLIFAIFQLSLSQSLTEYDERCSTLLPQRCQSNTTCYADTSSCRISNVCSQPGRPYQCPDNQCADRFFNCITKQLECRFKGQTRCPDGFCRRNDCKDVKYSSCPMSSPLLCGSGRCVSYLFQCAGGSYCPLSRPFLCPDMSC